jgi:hypothetical protein
LVRTIGDEESQANGEVIKGRTPQRWGALQRALERFRAKHALGLDPGGSVRLKTRQNKKIERGRDSIQSERALEPGVGADGVIGELVVLGFANSNRNMHKHLHYCNLCVQLI